MPRPPRFMPPHSLQHVVDSTFQNRLFFTPSKELNQRFLGVLGRAQKQHEMTIHAVVVAATHYHLLLSPKDARHLAKFMCFVKTNLSKEIGTRLQGWKGSFFAGRFHTTTVSTEELAQVRTLRYILGHGPKEFLVDTVRQWPGVHCADALITGQNMPGTWFDRSAEHKTTPCKGISNLEANTSNEVVELSPLPCWQHLPEATWRQAVADLVDDIDREAASQRAARGKPSLGVRKVLSAHPHDIHHSEKTPGNSTQPRFHAVDKGTLKGMVELWQATLTAFHAASELLRAGDRTAVFPEGTFPPALPFVPFTKKQQSRGQPA